MIDSHCHLNDEKFKDEIDDIVNNFENAGVKRVVNISASMLDSWKVTKLSKKYPSVYYSIGVHPEDCENFNVELFEHVLRQVLGKENNSSPSVDFLQDFEPLEPIFDDKGKNKLLAIGEIGLDYYWTKDNKKKQIEIFEQQIKLAKKYELPIIVHNRDASGDILNILKRYAPYDKAGIIHCFSASREFAEEVIKLGFLISFAGSVTFKNAVNLQAVAKWVPEDKFLVETDAPYLAPVPFRGERNEPKMVIETANYIANLKGVSLEHIDKCTSENFNRLFNFN